MPDLKPLKEREESGLNFKTSMFIMVAPVILIIGLYSLLNNLPAETGISNDLPENPAPIDEETFKHEEKVFGHSESGREIKGYVIGSGEEILLFFGGIHGNEKGTVDLLNRLVSEIGADPDLLAPTKRLIIVPLANPDGFFDRDDKLNANEVNLNLNFATTGWQQYGDSGTFAGEEPFTESESRVIAQIVKEYGPDMMIAYHSQGALISPELDDQSVALGQWYAEQTGYLYFDEWDDSGTATKWFTETTGYPAITVELTNHTDSDWEINKKAIFELIHKDIFE